MRAIVTGDLHLGLNTDSYYVKGQGNSRLAEQRETLMYIIDYAIEEKIDTIIVAGDIFDNSNPNAIYEFGFNSVLARAKRYNKRFILLQGNHDWNRNGYGALGPIKALFSCEGDDRFIKIIDEPVIFENILWMPHCSIAKAQDYCDFVTSLALASKPKYLIGHFHAVGAKVGFERTLLSNGELSIKSYPESVKLAILGHIHKPQEFEVAGVSTVYVGSTQKNDISENDEHKRFLDIDFYTGEYKSMPITTCKDYGIVKISENQVEKFDWSSYRDNIMHIEINNYTGVYTRTDIKKMLPENTLIKTIKLIKEEEEQIKQSKDNRYKKLDFKGCIDQYFDNKEIADIAKTYLERAYET
jgi:exonuclease SbcD